MSEKEPVYRIRRLRLVDRASSFLEFIHNWEMVWELLEFMLILCVFILLFRGLDHFSHATSLILEAAAGFLSALKFLSIVLRWYHARYGSPPI
jgi:hypothetical protein